MKPWLGGGFGMARYLGYLKELDQLAEIDPFRLVDLNGSFFATAVHQDFAAASLHVRMLDRLHLAAMKQHHVRRLMTHDAIQAAAAKVLGWEVVTPI